MQVEISFRQIDDAEKDWRLDRFYDLLLGGAITSAKRASPVHDNVIIQGKQLNNVNNTRNDSNSHQKD